MHVSLTPELENQVKRRVDSGLFNNASEAVRERLRAEIHVGYEQLQRGEGASVTTEAEFQALARAAR